MAIMKKIGIVTVASSLIGFLSISAAGCSEGEEREDKLSGSLTQAVTVLDDNIKDFVLMGADVDKTGFEFDVSFNGIASSKNDTTSFACINYSVPSSYFTSLTKRSSKNDVYDVLDRVVSELEIKDYSLVEMNDLAKFNGAIVKNTPSPFEKYNLRRGMVYNLEKPEFDDENRTVSFDVKTIADLRKGSIRPGIGLGIGFHGGVGFGVGLFTSVNEGTFMIVDNYSVSFSQSDYQAVKENYALIYDYVAEAIENTDDSKLEVKRVYTNDVTYDCADRLSHFNVQEVVKNLETENE